MGNRKNSTPTWFIFLTTVALVLGGYYMLLGLRDYVRTGGLGVVEATLQAEVRNTATAVRRETEAIPTATLIATFTPVPDCQDWTVTVPSGIIRAAATTGAPMVEVVDGGEIICVIRRVPETDWYLIDVRPETSRIEEGYMRNDIIAPLQPTATPSLSPTPLPTVTPVTPSPTVTPSATPTDDPNATATPSGTPPATATPTPTQTNTPPPGRAL